MKSLQDSFTFKELNKSGAITGMIGKIMQDATVLSPANMEEAFVIINKNYKYPLKNMVMEFIQSGRIKMVYAPTSIQLPTCLPYFMTLQNGQITAIVNIDIYGKLDKETNDVKIDPRKLYCMLEGAAIGLIVMESNTIKGNTSIAKAGSAIYSAMFTRVLNKKYALNTDRDKQNKIIFLTSKFFLINVMGMPNNDTTTNYAMMNCKNPNNITLTQLDDNFDEEYYNDFGSFITGLKEDPSTNKIVTDLTARGYFEKFIQMYDATLLLGLESLPYFIYNINGVILNAYVNKQYALEDSIGRDGQAIYGAIVALGRRNF